MIAKLSNLLKPGGCLVLNFDFTYAGRICYPINLIHALNRAVRARRIRSDVVIHRTVDEAIDALDAKQIHPECVVMRPRDAYRGLSSRAVSKWIDDSGLKVFASIKEKTRLFDWPFPIPVGEMRLARK